MILLAKHAQHVVLIHFPIALLLSEPCSISYREGSAIRNLLASHTGGLSASAYRGLSTESFIGANRIGPLPEPEINSPPPVTFDRPTAYTLISTFPA